MDNTFKQFVNIFANYAKTIMYLSTIFGLIAFCFLTLINLEFIGWFVGALLSFVVCIIICIKYNKSNILTILFMVSAIVGIICGLVYSIKCMFAGTYNYVMIGSIVAYIIAYLFERIYRYTK